MQPCGRDQRCKHSSRVQADDRWTVGGPSAGASVEHVTGKSSIKDRSQGPATAHGRTCGARHDVLTVDTGDV
jgi:hypothetical protein